MPTIPGTPDSDDLTGTEGDDVIHGYENNDLINGSLGVDFLYGDAGDDRFVFRTLSYFTPQAPIGLIDGGSGFDVLDLRSLSAATFGVIQSSTGQFSQGVYIGSQRYQVRNVEQILFGNSDDFISLSSGLTQGVELRAGGGSDYVSASGSNIILGEAGDDIVFLSGSFGTPSQFGIIDGGEGSDSLSLNISFDVDAAAGFAIAGTSTYQIRSFEHFLASANGGYGSVVRGSEIAETFEVNSLFNDGSVGIVFDGRGGDDQLIGSRAGDTLAGGSGLDTLSGEEGEDFLDGGADADLLAGGLGNDTYVVDNLGDVVVELAQEGTDTVYSSVSLALLANVEYLVLTGFGASNGIGNTLDNVIVGNVADNILDGGAGNDALAGGSGNDSYLVDSIYDGVVEYASEGNDTVYSTVGTVLTPNVENLVLIGTGNDTAVGNELDNILVGNAGNNILDGRAGRDAMAGLGGDDSYFVDTVYDGVIEYEGGGIDTVYSTANTLLTPNVENLQLLGSADLVGIGNGLANVLIGNAGANQLDGGAGADLLFGGDNVDVFVFRAGQANGDIVLDFTGLGDGAGDVLAFIGFGAGSTFAKADGAADLWRITDGVSGAVETIKVVGDVVASDYFFV